MARGRYSPLVKAQVVERALSGDVSKRQVAEEAGISATTLFRWLREEAPRGKVERLRVLPPPAAEQEGSPGKRQTVSQAAEAGNRRELLVAMRARVAKTVEDPNTPARDLAALTRRLLEIANEIEAIDSADGDDEIGKAAGTPDDDWDASAI